MADTKVIGTDINHTIANGDSATFFVDTRDADAIEVEVNDNTDSTDYDVTVRTGNQGNHPREVGFGDLSAIVPATFTAFSGASTNNIVTTNVGYITAVRITNADASNSSFVGTIRTHNRDDAQSSAENFASDLSHVFVNGGLYHQEWTPRSDEPASPAAGDVYFDDGTNHAGSGGLRQYDGSAWADL